MVISENIKGIYVIPSKDKSLGMYNVLLFYMLLNYSNLLINIRVVWGDFCKKWPL